MRQTFRLGRGSTRPEGWRTRRALRWLLIGLAGIALVFLMLSWPRMQLRADMATGFGARIACGCRYIEGRDLKSCQSDFKGLNGMGLVRLQDDPQSRTVRASMPLLASRSATFRPGFGCMPDTMPGGR